MADSAARELRRLAQRMMSTQARHVVWLMLLTLVNTAAQGATVVLLIPLLKLAGVAMESGSVSALDQMVSVAFRSVHLTPTLPIVLAVFVGVAWLQAVLEHFELVGTARLEQAIVRDLRLNLYQALLAARWRFFTARRTTDLTHAVTIDTERAGAAVGFLLRAAAQCASAAIYAGLAIGVSPVASAVALAGGLVLAVLLRPTLQSAHEIGDRMTEVSTDALALVTRHVDAMKLVKSYGAEARTMQAFQGIADQSARFTVDATRRHARAHVATIAGSATLLGITLYVAIHALHLGAATILVLTFLFWRLVPRLMDIQQSVRLALYELPGFEAVRRTIDDAVAEREAPPGHPMALPDPAPKGSPAVIRSGVVFDAVAFAYATAPVLRQCSCEIAAGQITAFAGPSGAGKTTVVDLLLGLLTPTSGIIRVDGRALTTDWLSEWRTTVAYVPQDPLLFHDTVLANLLWANPSASMPEVWSALSAAAADEFVRRMPMGLDTVVGDRGIRISGGERQRLALARALLRKPALLVLDEATSAIDGASETRILQALVALRGTMAIVLVSHRAAPIACADVVYRIADGMLSRQPSGALYP